MKSTQTLPRIPSAGPREDTVRLPDGKPPLPAGTQLFPSLPNLPPPSGIVRTKDVVPESGHVIHLSTSSAAASITQEEPSELPPEWVKKQLEFSETLSRSKVGWENEIARHILSLYATSTARKNIKESQSLLDFVGDKERTNQAHDHDHDSKHHYHHSITTNIPGFHRPTEPKPNHLERNPSAPTLSQSQNVEELQPVFEEDVEEETKPKKMKKKKVKKAKKMKEEESKQETEQDREKSQLISEILSAIDHHANISGQKDLYRITNTIRTRDGQEIVVRGTPRCFPIWFTSTGDVYANWTKLPGKRHLQAHLGTLYEHGYYKEYLMILETIIVELFRLHVYGPQEFTLTSFGLSSRVTDFTSRPSPNTSNKRMSTNGAMSSSGAGGMDIYNTGTAEGRQRWIDGVLEQQLSAEVQANINRFMPEQQHLANQSYSRHRGSEATTGDESENRTADLSLPEIIALYEQLILTTLAIVVLCIEKKQYEQALNFLNSAERLCGNMEVLPDARMRKHYKGYVADTMAYYFYRRKKLLAAKEYSERAMATFEKAGDYEGVGGCLLHIAAVLSGLSKFKESHKMIYQFLAMVESGRLSTAAATPKQLCMVSVAYHNLAVLQLKLNCSDLACKNSQNARKIARLCLSYSNRYIDTFQYTHQVAISDMKYDLSMQSSASFTREQLLVIKELSEALFAVDAEVIKQPGQADDDRPL